MKELSVFIPWIEPLVLHCPMPAMRTALRDTAIEFCRTTKVLQITTDLQSAYPNVAEYDLQLPPFHNATILMSAWYGVSQMAPLYVVGADGMDFPAFLNPQLSGVPTYGPRRAGLMDGNTTVRIYPLPDPANPGYLSFRVAIVPTRECNQLNDQLFDQWLDAMVQGTVARLAQTPGQTYTSLTAAGNATIAYNHEKTRATIQATKGNALVSDRITMRPMA